MKELQRIYGPPKIKSIILLLPNNHCIVSIKRITFSTRRFMKNLLTLLAILVLVPLVATANDDYRKSCISAVTNGRQAFVTQEEISSCSKILSIHSLKCVSSITNGRQAFLNESEITSCSFIKSKTAATCVFYAFNGREAYADYRDILSCVE
jgi:hypothetical protein